MNCKGGGRGEEEKELEEEEEEGKEGQGAKERGAVEKGRQSRKSMRMQRKIAVSSLFYRYINEYTS